MDLTFFLRLLSSLQVLNQIDLPALLPCTLWYLNIYLSNQSCYFVLDLTFFLKLLSSLRALNQIDLPALLFYTLWYLSCNLLNLIQKVHASINLSKQSCYFAIMHTFVLQLTPSWQVLYQVDVVALLLCLLLHLTSICLLILN